MKLPSRNSVTGQVLRLMLDGKARSKLEITDQLNLHPAKEVTARLRDFRKPEGEGGLRMDINVPWRLTGLNKKTMRRGRFSLPIRSVEESTLPIRRIMGQCVIVRAEMMFMTGNIDYHATSWRFREVQEGCVIPVYEWIWCETEDQLTAREISA